MKNTENTQLSQENQSEKIRHGWKEYFNFGPVFGYFFRKHDPSRPSTFNLKMMHGINKISMLMFLVCVIIIIVRAFFAE